LFNFERREFLSFRNSNERMVGRGLHHLFFQFEIKFAKHYSKPDKGHVRGTAPYVSSIFRREFLNFINSHKRVPRGGLHHFVQFKRREFLNI
jgi:hypothetical protein